MSRAYMRNTLPKNVGDTPHAPRHRKRYGVLAPGEKSGDIILFSVLLRPTAFVFEYRDPATITPAILAMMQSYRNTSTSQEKNSMVSPDFTRWSGQPVCPKIDGVALTSIAPDIIEAILGGDEFDGLSLEKLRKNLPVRWDKQRKQWR